MEQTTIRLPAELLERIDESVADTEQSRSEYIREELRAAEELRERVDALEEEVADLETELERVHREKRQVLEQREEHGELVAAVQEERDAEQRRREAGVMTRAKWWLTGMPAETDE
jgi:Arc/MetJ-type ribon-helix-helix transcriptional regulator